MMKVRQFFTLTLHKARSLTSQHLSAIAELLKDARNEVPLGANANHF
ncbi:MULTISPECIES: hypothetical protein [unclassified Coleofasciculus]|nr:MULTISPECIES: hypothetical protein [unclassified Coleofasciculus]MBD1840033.1 hypothetical protein [Coleofasciculus sp. FACHB-501]MBD1889160.1 hypothetical protein [Coleofasciculus sp. FACHB-SPT9]